MILREKIFFYILIVKVILKEAQQEKYSFKVHKYIYIFKKNIFDLFNNNKDIFRPNYQ